MQTGRLTPAELVRTATESVPTWTLSRKVVFLTSEEGFSSDGQQVNRFGGGPSQMGVSENRGP